MQLSTRQDPRTRRAPARLPAESIGEDDNPFGGAAGPAIAIPNVLAIAQRNWRLIALCGLGFLALAVAYVLLATPLYTSTASLLIDTRMNQTLQKQNIIEDTPVDTSMVDSQVNVLQSDSVGSEVVRKLNLTQDPEFVGPPSGGSALLIYNTVGFIKGTLAKLGLKSTPVVDASALLERTALDSFEQHLVVKREELSFVIDVSFTSNSPEKAAKIANAVTYAYMAADLAAKVQSTHSANLWLQNRLIELKAQATDADHQLQRYKAANNIVETGRGLLDQQSLTDLNSQMITAKAATAEAKARLDRMQEVNTDGIPDATVTDALNSPIITRLRAQYLDTLAKRSDLIRTLGPNHIAVRKLQDQMDNLKKSILGEERRIADAYQSDYRIAQARQDSLTTSMSQMVGQSEATNQAQVKARDLESSADTYRNIYNSFLQKFQETEQAQTIPVNDSRVVSTAQVPLKKSSPKTLLAIVGGLMFGLMLGTSAAVAKEVTANVFRTGGDVEQELGIRSLGILPDISDRAGHAGPEHDLNEWVLRAPYSRFTETIRSIYVALRLAKFENEAMVIGVVSSVPKEGKTTVAANLGALVASLGWRTLLIDGDMHERSLSKTLAPKARGGLLEAIASPSKLSSLVTRRKRSTLDVLPCVTDERPFNAAEVLGSAQMVDLLDVARSTYDVIIVEFAPIMSVVDVRASGHLADKFVFVVKWGESKKNLVTEALAVSEVVRDRVAGIVLNKADPVALRSLEAYKGKTYTNYYRE